MRQSPITSDLPNRASNEDGEIDLARLSGTLWRGKLWIALCGLLAVLAGGYYASGLVSVYTAKTYLALETRQQQVMDIESAITGLGGDQASINTQVEVLQSRGLIEKLVLDMELLEDPEFNSRLRPEPRFTLSQGINLLRNKLRSFIAPESKIPPPPQNAASERAALDRTINAVLNAISVSNLRQTFVFEITANTQDPKKSAAIANRLAELYTQNQISGKFEQTEQATVWLSERVSSLQIELEAAQAELKDFSTNTELVNVETLAALNRQLKDLRDRRSSLAAQAEAATSRANALREALDVNPEAFAEVADDTLLDQALLQLRDGLTGGQEAFDTRARALVGRAGLEASRANAQFQAVADSIDDVTKRIDKQSRELMTLEQLQREAEATRMLYEAFLSRLKETSIQQGIQQADSRILSRAVVPSAPSAPNKSRILSLFMILGLMAGAGLVLLRELRQNTFRLPEDLEEKTGYSVIGQIPKIAAKHRKNVLEYLTQKPNSAAAEAVRNLRTSLLLTNLDTPPKVIMSTSSVPGEGKTTQSIALAQNFADLGTKVLLIEGDLRRRVLDEYFNYDQPKGFLSVISGDVSLKDATVYDDVLKADILFAEPSRINAADLFSSKTFSNFISELRDQYDHVIIDTPPVLAVPDARVIGQLVDSVIYTVKWDSTPRRQVLDGLKSLENVNIKPNGLVLSQIDKRKMKRYGYGDSYGDYGAYHDS